MEQPARTTVDQMKQARRIPLDQTGFSPFIIDRDRRTPGIPRQLSPPNLPPCFLIERNEQPFSDARRPCNGKDDQIGYIPLPQHAGRLHAPRYARHGAAEIRANPYVFTRKCVDLEYWHVREFKPPTGLPVERKSLYTDKARPPPTKIRENHWYRPRHPVPRRSASN